LPVTTFSPERWSMLKGEIRHSWIEQAHDDPPKSPCPTPDCSLRHAVLSSAHCADCCADKLQDKTAAAVTDMVPRMKTSTPEPGCRLQAFAPCPPYLVIPARCSAAKTPLPTLSVCSISCVVGLPCTRSYSVHWARRNDLTWQSRRCVLAGPRQHDCSTNMWPTHGRSHLCLTGLAAVPVVPAPF
jgi:hypothetical protein